jgi:hypothetical protein
MLMNVKFPHEPFNTAIRDGSAGSKIRRVLDEVKPEVVYFTEQDGHRGATLIVNVNDPSQIPALAEPWFLLFDADIELRVAMTADDLGRAGLEALGKKWA